MSFKDSLGSGLFSKAAAKLQHLITHGIAAEVGDVRQDVHDALAPIAAIAVEEYTDPPAGGAAVLLAATATTVAVQTYLPAGLLAGGLATLASQPRNITFTTAGSTASDAPANVVITGTDRNGKVQTETVTLAQTATIAKGVKCFKTITSIVYAAGDGTGATVSIGIGDAMPMAKKILARAGLTAAVKEIAAGSVVTTGTFDATNLTYTPATSPNGTNDYAIYYEYDATL